MKSVIRHSGVPTIAQFAGAPGPAIVIDTDTGTQYWLNAGDTVTAVSGGSGHDSDILQWRSRRAGEIGMAKTRIIYDRDGSKLAEFVNDECVFSKEPMQTNSAPAVMGDIQPYRSMADGTWITSRSQHRAHLRQHGLIEIGNEIKAAMQKPQPKHDNTLRKTIVDAYKAMKA